MSVLRNYEQLAKSAGATLRTSHPELRRSQDALSVHHPKFVPPPVGSISPTHNHARAGMFGYMHPFSTFKFDPRYQIFCSG